MYMYNNHYFTHQSTNNQSTHIYIKFQRNSKIVVVVFVFFFSNRFLNHRNSIILSESLIFFFCKKNIHFSVLRLKMFHRCLQMQTKRAELNNREKKMNIFLVVCARFDLIDAFYKVPQAIHSTFRFVSFLSIYLKKKKIVFVFVGFYFFRNLKPFFFNERCFHQAFNLIYLIFVFVNIFRQWMPFLSFIIVLIF